MHNFPRGSLHYLLAKAQEKNILADGQERKGSGRLFSTIGEEEKAEHTKRLHWCGDCVRSQASDKDDEREMHGCLLVLYIC